MSKPWYRGCNNVSLSLCDSSQVEAACELKLILLEDGTRVTLRHRPRRPRPRTAARLQGVKIITSGRKENLHLHFLGFAA